jgi:hypothetical protein
VWKHVFPTHTTRERFGGPKPLVDVRHIDAGEAGVALVKTISTYDGLAGKVAVPASTFEVLRVGFVDAVSS